MRQQAHHAAALPDSPLDLCTSRWAERGAVGYEALAEDGFMILAERLRGAEERQVVGQVLAKVLKAQPDMEQVGGRAGGCAGGMMCIVALPAGPLLLWDADAWKHSTAT